MDSIEYRIVPRMKTIMVCDGGMLTTGHVCDSPASVVPLARQAMFGTPEVVQPVETFLAIGLDSRNKAIASWVVSQGILTASIVHPREVFRPALMVSASAIIICHNHPSGDPTPSRDDDEVTKRIAKAGELLGIALLDHLILGDPGHHWSYREHGSDAFALVAQPHPIVDSLAKAPTKPGRGRKPLDTP